MAQIKNFEDLIAPVLGKDKQFLDFETANLTVAGDNYGSSMLKVDIKVKNKKNNETEIIHAVAKMLPQNEFTRKAFNTEFTFRNEVGFYEKIAPCLRDFQQEHGLTKLYDSFPPLYCSRLSLNPGSTELGDDAVLLIKNIKYEGYGNVDRKVGFDLDQTRMILGKMAELHGTFMAFKALKSEVFDREMSQFFKEYKIFDFDDTNLASKVTDTVIEVIKDDEFCTRHMEKIKGILELIILKKTVKNKKEDLENPFLSLVHSDMWTNNIMLKIVDGKTTDVKFVDYQIYEYSSLTRDVIFFLLTSVQIEVVKEHLDDLLSFYYENLMSWLKKFNYDISPLSFQAFIESIKKVLLEMEFFHVMIMLGPMYADNEHVKDVEEMNEDALVE